MRVVASGSDCPYCKSTEFTCRPVDEREQRRCAKCGKRWYTHRGWSSGRYTTRDRIAETVVHAGYAEEPTSIFINGAFPDLGDEFSAWLVANDFKARTLHKLNPRLKKHVQYVRVEMK